MCPGRGVGSHQRPGRARAGGSSSPFCVPGTLNAPPPVFSQQLLEVYLSTFSDSRKRRKETEAQRGGSLAHGHLKADSNPVLTLNLA